MPKPAALIVAHRRVPFLGVAGGGPLALAATLLVVSCSSGGATPAPNGADGSTATGGNTGVGTGGSFAGSGGAGTGGAAGAGVSGTATGGTAVAGTGGTAASGGSSAAGGGAGTSATNSGGRQGQGQGGVGGPGAAATGGRAGGTGGDNSGGNTATGGRAGSGGQTGTGGATAACGSIASTDTRPQLTSSQAANFTILKYLAQSDNWNPTAGLGQASSFTANFTVAADGSGTHTTVQAALNAAASGSARRYILIKPGTYRGSISLSAATPITLYGADSDASKVVIVDGQSATSAGSTAKSATFTSTADGLQLMNLTISNDFATPPTGTNIQAVALYTTGDKNVFQNVRLHGFQDTLFTDTASESRASRVYIKDSFIEGDTDFIFGGATLVIDGGSINYLSSRKASGGGACLAPSTRTSNSYGFLVTGASFTAAPTALANKVSLGRSWDEGGISPTPNGQAVVRESTLGPHIRKIDPWAAAATSARPFSATGNRFSEYCNSGPGSGP